MKHPLKALVAGFALSVLAPLSAQAVMIDFTKHLQFAPNSTSTVDLNGTTVQPVTFGIDGLDFDATEGDLEVTATWTPVGAQTLGSEGIPGDVTLFGLAGQTDGFGIKNDEITGGTSQSLTLDFSRSVWIDDILLLDVFDAPDGNGLGERGRVQLFKDDASVADFVFGFDGLTLFAELNGSAFDAGPTGGDGVQALQINGGLIALSTQAEDPLLRAFEADRLVFSAPGSTGNDFAVAGINVQDVTAVPVPAALPLMGAVLAGFLLGILESFASTTWATTTIPGINQIIIYLVAIIVLLTRPRGLMGRKGVMED